MSYSPAAHWGRLLPHGVGILTEMDVIYMGRWVYWLQQERWLHMNGWMDGRTDGKKESQTIIMDYGYAKIYSNAVTLYFLSCIYEVHQ